MTRFSRFDKPPKATTCAECGERYAEGDWPFCISAANPEGHSKGAYGFRMGFKMATQGWTRREK